MKDNPDPERHQKWNRANVPTDEMKNANGTNKGGDLLFVNKPWAVTRGTKRVP